jgi:hypothetical protein
MAGIFGDMGNRADFFRSLTQATDLCKSLIARLPQESTLQSVLAQLETIAIWTAHGRTPTAAERKSLDLSLRMFRSYETLPDVEIDRLSNQSAGIHNYVEAWPSDVVAADPDNGKYAL